jgi:hypothetical protein
MITPAKLNRFLMMRLPAEFLCGVRVRKIDDRVCEVGVKYRWINTNPFRSMYFAVQSMAAELATGALVLQKAWSTGKPISTLITSHEGEFTKKARGRIVFVCKDGEQCDMMVENAVRTGEAQTATLEVTGTDESGEVVSKYKFLWSVKLKSKK